MDKVLPVDSGGKGFVGSCSGSPSGSSGPAWRGSGVVLVLLLF